MPVSTTQAQLGRTLERHESTLEEHTTRLNEHDYLLNGIKDVKDSHGLVQDVSDMSEVLKSMSKLWAQQAVWNRIFGVIALPLVAAIVGLLWSLLTGDSVLIKP